MGSPIAAGILAAANPKYRFAAYAYLIYGVIYMTGAAHLGLTGASSRPPNDNRQLHQPTGLRRRHGCPARAAAGPSSDGSVCLQITAEVFKDVVGASLDVFPGSPGAASR